MGIIKTMNTYTIPVQFEAISVYTVDGENVEVTTWADGFARIKAPDEEEAIQSLLFGYADPDLVISSLYEDEIKIINEELHTPEAVAITRLLLREGYAPSRTWVYNKNTIIRFQEERETNQANPY